jgi:hypothetical protein
MATGSALAGVGSTAADASEGYFASQPYGTHMQAARAAAAAAPLPNGDVLITGGYNEEVVALQSAELFDPTDDTFTLLPNSPRQARWGAVASPLPDGEVLIAGGRDDAGGSDEPGRLRNAELFNPSTDQFTALPEAGNSEMQAARVFAIAAPLATGDVLIAGGNNEATETLRSAEIFDPSTDAFSALPEQGRQEMLYPRAQAVAAPLPDGNVLISGGSAFGSQDPGQTAELFNPTSEMFEAFPMTSDGQPQEQRGSAAGAGLADGQVLIVSGRGGEFYVAGTAELFNVAQQTFSLIGGARFATATEGRLEAFAAPLPNGQALIGGGRWYGDPGQHGVFGYAELFYSAPQATVAGGSFGSEVVGQPSQQSAITLTNVGAQELAIAGVTVQGPDPTNFALVTDACVARRLAFEQTCQITAAFTPTTTGARTATVALIDNEQTPTEITLSGTGVAAASSSASASSPSGDQTDDTPLRATTSAGDVTTHLIGSGTPLLLCRVVIRHSAPVQRCITKHTSAPVTNIGPGPVAAVLSRDHHVFASGWVVQYAGATRLLLTPRRRVTPGSYTLTLTHDRKRLREPITVQ